MKLKMQLWRKRSNGSTENDVRQVAQYASLDLINDLYSVRQRIYIPSHTNGGDEVNFSFYDNFFSTCSLL